MLLISANDRFFFERGLEGSARAGYFELLRAPSFTQGKFRHRIFGCVTATGTGLPDWNQVKFGKGVKQRAEIPAVESLAEAIYMNRQTKEIQMSKRVVLLLIMSLAVVPGSLLAGDAAAGKRCGRTWQDSRKPTWPSRSRISVTEDGRIQAWPRWLRV
jgi:hypothetical protein